MHRGRIPDMRVVTARIREMLPKIDKRNAAPQI